VTYIYFKTDIKWKVFFVDDQQETRTALFGKTKSYLSFYINRGILCWQCRTEGTKLICTVFQQSQYPIQCSLWDGFSLINSSEATVMIKSNISYIKGS